MQKNECEKIKACRLCDSKRLINVINLGKTPLANSYSKFINKKVKRFPLKVNFCKKCGHLQLGHSIKPEKMFSYYLYQTNTSKKNFMHFKNYAAKVDKLIKKPKKKILDIASNDGTFLNFFNKNNLRLGIDPAKNLQEIAKKKGVNQIRGFFSYKKSVCLKKKYGLFDIITANHVCAHVANIKDFFLGVKNLLSEKGYFVFEVSYRGSVLKKNTFDTIYHEHIDYHALKPIKIFSSSLGFKIFNFEITEAQGGSLRVYLTKSKVIKHQKKINEFISDENKKMNLFKIKKYKNFQKKIFLAKKKLKIIINHAKKNNLKIAGYGAAAKTTTLLNFFEINDKDIIFIIDDNKLKQGLYMPGRSIKIVTPEEIIKNQIDIMLIFAWNYSDFIIKIIKKKYKFTKKNKLKFLVPFPNPKIIL